MGALNPLLIHKLGTTWPHQYSSSYSSSSSSSPDRVSRPDNIGRRCPHRYTGVEESCSIHMIGKVMMTTYHTHLMMGGGEEEREGRE